MNVLTPSPRTPHGGDVLCRDFGWLIPLRSRFLLTQHLIRKAFLHGGVPGTPCARLPWPVHGGVPGTPCARLSWPVLRRRARQRLPCAHGRCRPGQRQRCEDRSGPICPPQSTALAAGLLPRGRCICALRARAGAEPPPRVALPATSGVERCSPCGRWKPETGRPLRAAPCRTPVPRGLLPLSGHPSWEEREEGRCAGPRAP